MSVSNTKNGRHPAREVLSRRQVLWSGARLVGGLLLLSLAPVRAWAQALEGIFKERTVDDVLKALGEKPIPSDQIVLTTPDIAENGSVVPITVKSSIPSTTDIYLIVEKNPNPFAAAFSIPDQTDAMISARLKVAQTSNVIAVVKADGKLFSVTRETKVTLGGCGG